MEYHQLIGKPMKGLDYDPKALQTWLSEVMRTMPDGPFSVIGRISKTGYNLTICGPFEMELGKIVVNID